jgi:hypothetical protein
MYRSKAFAADCVEIKVSQYPGNDTAKVSISGLDMTATECTTLFALLAAMRSGKGFVV